MKKDSFSSNVIIYSIAFLIIGGILLIKPNLKFTMMYKSETENVICKMVKAEYLTDEGLKRCHELMAP